MKFNVTNIKGEAPMFAKRFLILGDEISTKLTVSLKASPVGMEFGGDKKPTHALDTTTIRSSRGSRI